MVEISNYAIIIKCSLLMSKIILEDESSTAITMCVCSFLSSAASVFVIWTFYHYKALDIFQIKMIATLTTFDLIWSLQNLTIPLILAAVDGTPFMASEHPVYCNIQGWAALFSISNSLWWTSAICHQILISVKPRRYSGSHYYKAYMKYGLLVATYIATV
jgi:hypothetical protein